MSNTAPPVNPGTASALAADITSKLLANVSGWSPTDPSGAPDQAGAALISVVSRFGEIVIKRLNRAPDKNFLAFLDLLGTAPLPEPRAPLTFGVGRRNNDTVVPAGTGWPRAARG
jgi:hypothetical protein